jgi:gliding motility-associated-like protein
MKKYFFIIVLFLLSIPATARHVAGGEVFYEYLGPGSNPGTSMYLVTMRLFRDCNSNGPQLEGEVVNIGFYSQGQLYTFMRLPVPGNVTTIRLNTANFPCLVGNVDVCYQMAVTSGVITLPDNADGYTVVRHGQNRIDYIGNLAADLNVGSTYVTRIPGTNVLGIGHNNSPQFNVRDTALVCSSKPFTLDFGATDKDGDSLSYSFCEGYLSPIPSNSAPPAQLTLIGLPYASPFSGTQPLGPGVTINPATGIISGIVPPVGYRPTGEPRNGYVVSVCITEWRNGRAIAEHRKDFILKVQSCDFVEAVLPDKIIQCQDSIVHFENGSSSSAIIDYLWEFGDSKSSKLPVINYPYADTGRYTVFLTVHGPKGCIGIDSTQVYVYPGFKPAFNITGSCFSLPYQFTDNTTTKYGFVDSWRWDFGDLTTDADTSTFKNATFKYAAAGQKNIKLVVTSSKGCIDSLSKDYLVRDKPPLNLPFKDTLICSIDTLAIPLSIPGNFSWTPNKNILYANTGRPLVFPKDTTKYIVTVTDQGCTNSDTVTVNVLQFITVQLGNDSVICRTDIVQLHPVSHALQYHWTSSSGENVEQVKYPFVKPLVNTKYYVTANLGKCQDRDSVTIVSIPYPIVILGPDTAICLGNRLQLHSAIKASFLTWAPTASLTGFLTGSPIAGPTKTTTYIATVRDTLGCPKSVSDSIVVIVAPPVQAYAGKDTVAIIGQPLQMMADGGVKYVWSPESFLSNIFIADPIVTIPGFGVDSIRYTVRVSDEYGCYADDNVLVRIYKTGPEIFVPSAFTPNGDGRNDVLRPTTVGITRLNFFRVYNRYGQLVFNTTEIGKGWNGMFNGSPQPPGGYVFQAQGVDYKGVVVFRKGSSVLIR